MAKIFVDAQDTAMGRVASFAAKQALGGNEVAILNSEKAVISGRKEDNINDFKLRRQLNHMKPEKGPFFSRVPEKIMKRCVRGMVPDFRRGRGKIAISKVKCYTGIPAEFAEQKLIKVDAKLPVKAMSLSELSRRA
jgi:large subunit ribosomal protein L13